MGAAKKNLGKRGTIVFVDETGFSEGSVIRRTWSPRGQTPVLRTKGRSWSQRTAIGALAYSRCGRRVRVYVTTHEGATRIPQVLRFLRHLRRQVKGRVLIVWDRLAAHRGHAVTAWLHRHPRWQMELLPPYAPELNPVEGLWAWLKGCALANVCADTLTPIMKKVRSGVRRVRRRPQVLRGFLRRAGLFL